MRILIAEDEQAIRRAIAPYVRNIEQQKRFITAAGHELKTPITAISASADVLDMEIPDNEWVQNIQKQAVRLSSLTAELVELSRLSEEQPFPERAEFSLSDAAWGIAEAFSFSARAAGKRFTSEIAEAHGGRLTAKTSNETDITFRVIV